MRFPACSTLLLFLWSVSQTCPAQAPNSSAPPPHEEPPAGPNQPYPIIQIWVEHPILQITDSVPKPATRIQVQPLHFPPGARLTWDYQQVQDAISPFAAQVAQSPIAFSSQAAPVVQVTFPGPGVYEICVTVTDGNSHLSAKENTWINVWDRHSHILVNGKPDPLCAAPAIDPPAAVRDLSPDPGPFRHPRLYTTDTDWQELHSRCATGKIASFAVQKLREELSDSIDSDSSPFHKLTDELEAYADSKYQSPAPDLKTGLPEDVDGNDASKKSWDTAQKNLMEYYTHLRTACFLAWLDQDPHTAHDKVDADKQKKFRRLAKVLAAVNHLQLTNSWDAETGTFHKDYPLFIKNLDDLGGNFENYSDVALAYDFIAPWMTPEEQAETRNFLFAQAVGRTTGARVVFFASGVHGRVERGQEQNGDFMNIEEQKVLATLAIEGEEGAVPDKLRSFFLNLQTPPEDHKDDFYAYDWAHYTWFDGPRTQIGARPYPEASSWPFARKVEVDNLKRAQWWNDDCYVTPWGFELNHEAYYGFSAWGLWPTAVAYARHGAENQFVAANYYTTLNHLLWCSYGMEGFKAPDPFTPNNFLYDHHDGGDDYRQNHIVLMKYMYPTDPGVDYYYSADAAPSTDPNHLRPGISFNPFIDALFGLDPGVEGKPTTDLQAMAQAKGMPLTIVDPQEGIVSARSSWKADAAYLYFDEAWPLTGHMHAEKGNFTFCALGRTWSIPPGYHITESGNQSEVLIQDPKFADDPETQGYFGEGPNLEPDKQKFPDFSKSYPSCFPTPPGHLFPAVETPDKQFLIMAGENTVSYSYCMGQNRVDSGLHRSEFMYPGIFEDLIRRLPENKELANDVLNLTPNYNTVKYAYRTILFARGEHPYALVIDDIDKDDTPRNYRWQMDCSQIFGVPSLAMVDKDGKGVCSDLTIMPNSTATEGILYHSPIDDAPAEPAPPDPMGDAPKGPPRLLVKDLSDIPGDKASTPVMEVKTSKLGDNPDAIHRAYVYKNHVIDPKFMILLYPYLLGETAPTITWSPDHLHLIIQMPGKDNHRIPIDEITLDRSNPDHRTRIVQTRRLFKIF